MSLKQGKHVFLYTYKNACYSSQILARPLRHFLLIMLFCFFVLINFILLFKPIKAVLNCSQFGKQPYACLRLTKVLVALNRDALFVAMMLNKENIVRNCPCAWDVVSSSFDSVQHWIGFYFYVCRTVKKELFCFTIYHLIVRTGMGERLLKSVFKVSVCTKNPA